MGHSACLLMRDEVKRCIFPIIGVDQLDNILGLLNLQGVCCEAEAILGIED